MFRRQPGQCLAQQLARVLFLQAASGSFAGSATVVSIFSSNSASVRRRRAESALKRAIASSQVETEDRASNEAALRHTSRNTSLNRSSASVSLLTNRSSQR